VSGTQIGVVPSPEGFDVATLPAGMEEPDALTAAVEAFLSEADAAYQE
jgi:hypothetical protein